MSELMPADGLEPIPAPGTVPEVPNFPLPADSVYLGSDYLIGNVHVAREAAATCAVLTAVIHDAIVDPEDVRIITAELAANALRAGRYLTGITVEWHDKLNEIPVEIDSKTTGPAVGFVVLRVYDNQRGWYKDIRPEHDFGESESQKAPLLPAVTDEFSEEITAADFPELDLSGFIDGQSGRGLKLVGDIALAAGYYLTQSGKAVITVLPARSQSSVTEAA